MMKYCPVCGKVVPQGHGYKSVQKYCSSECFQIRNLPPKEEMLNTLNKNKNVTVSAHLFGVNKQALYGWMDHYGIKKQVLYTEEVPQCNSPK